MLRTVQSNLERISYQKEIKQAKNTLGTRPPIIKNSDRQLPNELLKNVSQLIYGKDKIFANEIQRNRYENRENLICNMVQRDVYENLFELCPSQRYKNIMPPTLLKRFDKKPYQDEVSWVKFNNNKEEKNFNFYLAGKSFLSQKNEIIPPGILPSEIYTELGAVELANIVYRHIGSTNKISETMPFEKDHETEISSQQRSEMKARLKIRQAGLPQEKIIAGKKSAPLESAGASALTSATHGSLIEGALQAWGDGRNHIQCCASEVLALPPAFMATLILNFANDEGMDELSRTSANDPTPYKWRDDNLLLPEKDPTLMKKIEKDIIKAGIDPDGAWTLRERAAYFAIVTQEYSILGKTNPGTANLVEAKKQ